MFDKGIIGWMMNINPTKYTVENQKMINCIFESKNKWKNIYHVSISFAMILYE